MKNEANVFDIIEYIDNQREFCKDCGAETSILTFDLPEVLVTIKLKFKFTDDKSESNQRKGVR